jgi:hypothetical protein
VAVLPASEGRGSTDCSSASFTRWTELPGWRARYRAAAPLTNGAAIEVPLYVAYVPAPERIGAVE